MEKDLYSILSVDRTASDADIKRAYRKLAQQYHPDVNKGDPESERKFKEVNLAYEVLSDRQKRQQYDQFGFTGGPGGGGGGFSGAGFDPSSFGGGFSDIFETFFGGAAAGGAGQRRKAGGPQPGNHIETTLSLSFEESIFGSEKELELIKADVCPHCKGHGNEPGSLIVECRECQATGQVRTVRQTILGNIQTVSTCPTCQGEGRVPDKKCTVCHGQMRTRQKSRVTVKIPSGVENGATIRLKGKGEAGLRGGEPGDLYLHIQVKPHPTFQRRADDIYSTHPLNLLQAVLGDEVEVATVHGPVKLKIPAGSQGEQVFKIKAYGVPHMKGTGKGDHYVKIRVEIPHKLTKREKELYQALAKEAGLEIQGESGGLFGKFKR